MWFVYSMLGILAFVLLIASILSLPRFDNLFRRDRPPPGMIHRE